MREEKENATKRPREEKIVLGPRVEGGKIWLEIFGWDYSLSTARHPMSHSPIGGGQRHVPGVGGVGPSLYGWKLK